MTGRSVFGVLVGTAMACGFAIGLVFEATAARIADNRTAFLEAAVGRVVPGVIRLAGFALNGSGLTPAAVDQADLIAGYDDRGRLAGVALPVGVMGYQDTVRMLFGYDPDRQRLTGFAVLEGRETPGLGSKIATDPAFLASLASLDVTLSGNTLATPVTLSGARGAPDSHQVDGITGATVSSSAVVRAVNDAAPRFAAVRLRLAALGGGATEDDDAR